MKRNIIFLLLISLNYVNLGCGSNKLGSSNQIATSPTTGTRMITNSAGKALAVCNRGDSQGLSVQLRQYEDVPGNPRNDLIRVKFLNAPTGLANTTNSYIAFYRWKADSNGAAVQDSSPLKIRVDSMMSYNFVPISNFSTALNWPLMSQVSDQRGLTIKNPTDFFGHFSLTIDLQDPFAEYDALKVVYYENDTATATVDVLLPTFYADPNQYQYDTQGLVRANVLQSLHPLRSMLGQIWPQTQFSSRFNQFCF
jgi:hypothetical protein